MPAESAHNLELNTASTVKRRWQFSIRSVLGLMLLASVALTLTRLYRYDGLLLFLAFLSLALFLYGILWRRVQAILWSVLLFLFLALPIVFLFVIALGLFYFVLGGFVLFVDWLLNRISNYLES